MGDYDLELDEMELVAAATGYYYYCHIDKQRDLIIAACVIHNLIRREERNDWLFLDSQMRAASAEVHDQDDQPETLPTTTVQEQAAFLLRHSIAAAMWNNFINEWDTW
ncbi:hypothetical protein BVC80_8753g17 [Macleaya cordata]|uniref:Uncharacterized protein n=1 Tax=Macleaya cordata TaxID=56857 RepID=A0A200QKA7_MACCD|nr:hypothetical protein BVC80_8753g17 [Macleaya cordata]